MITYQEIRENEEVQAYLKKGNENLGVLGYTDHSAVHCTLVAKEAGRILRELGYSEHEIELAKIAGMMHDIGNCVNRSRHAEYGAILANEILRNMDLSVEDRATIVSAIGLVELFQTGKIIIARNYQSFKMYAILAIFYLVIITLLTRLAKRLEKRIR